MATKDVKIIRGKWGIALVPADWKPKRKPKPKRKIRRGRMF